MNSQFASWITGAYAIVLSYLLLTPEPLFLLGIVGGEVHEAVDATVSTYMQHTIAYAIMTGLLCWLTHARGRWSPMLCVLLAGGHALLTEALQTLIPRRYGEMLDVLSDFAGIGITVLIIAAAPAMLGAINRVTPPVDSAGSDA